MVALLALGIGATVTVYAVDRAVVLDALPLAAPDRLVVLESLVGGEVGDVMAPVDVVDFRRLRAVFSGVAAWASHRATLGGTASPVYVSAVSVTPNFFETLGTSPVLGRLEGDVGDVFLSWQLWQSQFGGDSSVVGRSTVIDTTTHVIRGVLPQQLDFLPGDLWLVGPNGMPSPPFPVGSAMLYDRTFAYVHVIARMRNGVAIEDGQGAAQVVGARDSAAHATRAMPIHILLTPLRTLVAGDAKAQLRLLSIGTALVFLLVCCGVAGFLAASALARERDQAIKIALGATYGQAVAGWFVDAAMLTVAGGVVGALAAGAGIRFLVALAPPMHRSGEAHITGSVLVVVVGAIGIATLMAWIVPASRAVFGRGNHARLTRLGRTSSAGHTRVWTLLVGVQVGAMLILAVGSITALRRLRQLEGIPLGFDYNHVAAGTFILRPDRYAGVAKSAAFFNEVIASVAEQPGIEAAAVGSALPLHEGMAGTSFRIVDGPGGGQLQLSAPSARYSAVSPDYFLALGVGVVQGRGFTNEDRAGSEHVAIVNMSMVRSYWRGLSPIGAELQIGDSSLARVVGVVRDFRYDLLASAPEPHLYLPFAQHPSRAEFLVIRGTIGVGPIKAAVGRVVAETDPSQPPPVMTAMDQSLRGTLQPARYVALILGAFGGVAVLVAVLGLYGLLRFRADQEVYGTAIRLALGAPIGRLVWQRMVEGLIIAMGGMVSGCVVLFLAGSVVARLEPGLTWSDAPSLISAVVGCVLVAALACLVPAMRVLTVDPSQVGRSSY